MSPLFLRPVALGTAAFTLALAGCTTTTDSFLSSRVDYRAAAATPVLWLVWRGSMRNLRRRFSI